MENVIKNMTDSTTIKGGKPQKRPSTLYVRSNPDKVLRQPDE